MFSKNILNKLDEKNGNVWIAVSVIIAGLLVAGAVILTGGNKEPSVNQDGPLANGENDAVANARTISPITEENDYMISDINAPIKIVEYSDTECVFCKRIHTTLHNIVEEYPNDVVWVYRHLPIVSVNPKALISAHATECAGEQGGNEAFWKMLDSIYEETPGSNRFNLEKLTEFATNIGLDLDEYNSCMDSNRYNDKIKQQIEEGFAAGAKGTPFSIIITPNGEHIPVSGAQPDNVWKQIINQILAEQT